MTELGVYEDGTQRPDAHQPRRPLRSGYSYSEVTQRLGYRVTSFFEPFVGGGARHDLYGLGEREVDPEVLAGVALF